MPLSQVILRKSNVNGKKLLKTDIVINMRERHKQINTMECRVTRG